MASWDDANRLETSVAYLSATEKGHQAFLAMSEEMGRNYEKILSQFGEQKLRQLMQLL